MADDLKPLEETTNPTEEGRQSLQVLETTVEESVENADKPQEVEGTTALTVENGDQVKKVESTTTTTASPAKNEDQLQMEENEATAKDAGDNNVNALKEKTSAQLRTDSELESSDIEDVELNPPDASQDHRESRRSIKKKLKKPTRLSKRTTGSEKSNASSVDRRKDSYISRRSYRMDVKRKTNSSSESPNDNDSIDDRGIMKSDKQRTRFTLQDIFSQGDYEETPLPDFDENLSSSSSISEERELKRKCSVRFKEDFLKNFEDLPSISEITSDPVEEIEVNTMPPSKDPSAERVDIGQFVDPLTGKELSSTTSSESGALVLEQESVIEEEILVDDVDVFTIPYLPVVSSASTKGDDDSFDMFSIFEKIEKSEEDKPKEQTKEEKEQHQLHAATMEFLYGLFDSVVLTVEKGEGQIQRTTQFSKMALIEKLMALICEYNAHKLTNFDLHRKVVEHFKRNKVMRSILPLSSDVEYKEYTRYMQELRQFDHIIKKTLESKAHYGALIDAAKSQLNEQQAVVAKYEEDSKSLILETFGLPHLREVKKLVESDIASIQNKRNELGAVRLKLIKRQHILGSLIKKSDKLEKISDTLHMSTFISTQTEVQALDKKIEERNMELLRLQLNCNSDLHVLAHLKEKIQIVLVGTQIKKKSLDDLLVDQTFKRERLFQLKLIRTKLRKEFDELSFHSGLLSKPELMHDYDATFEQLEDQRKRIQKLQTRLADLLENIEAMKQQPRTHH